MTFTSLIAEVEGTAYHGHAGVRDWWRQVMDGLENVRYEMTELHDFGDRGYADLVVSAEVADVPVPQRMWQAFKVRDGRPYWWQTCRTESEARRLLELDP